MMQCVGFHRAAMAAQRGTYFKPDEALRVGLVDKVVPKDDLLKAAEKEMGIMIGVPGMLRGIWQLFQISKGRYLQHYASHYFQRENEINS